MSEPLSPLDRATIAAFNATATEEQKRVRDAILTAYSEHVTAAPWPTKKERAEYGTVRDAILADLREHPRSTSAEVAKRIGHDTSSMPTLCVRGHLSREPSGRFGLTGRPIYLYSVKEPA